MFEWTMLIYALFTLLLMLFMYTRLQDPKAMIVLRIQIVAITLALWGVYQLIPCRLLLLVRVIVQLALLSNWYSETFEFNRMLPNLDHVFATWEQQLFGCQPALLFCQKWSHPVFSELLTLGYVSYYPLMGVVALYYFIWRKEQFLKASFVILASFFLFYVIFIFLPVNPEPYGTGTGSFDSVTDGILNQRL